MKLHKKSNVMKLLKLYITGLLTVIFLAGTATAGVRPQLTRIVAYAQDRETPVDVINDSQETYMVQAWLEDLRGNDNDLPLVLTPPVMKLEAKKQGKIPTRGSEGRDCEGQRVRILAIAAGNTAKSRQCK
ncbi:Chaperone protein fimC precursor [Raoultella planticola]|uniref:Chaperone protein fimC n=1 Tax=Raoultella planticola TaxID=575 RepID=A0A485CV98_RAOPL|nr:Chaperone protein fimC precursor [Raoultella planticola]